jgi:hypothetical protein
MTLKCEKCGKESQFSPREANVQTIMARDATRAGSVMLYVVWCPHCQTRAEVTPPIHAP